MGEDLAMKDLYDIVRKQAGDQNKWYLLDQQVMQETKTKPAKSANQNDDRGKPDVKRLKANSGKGKARQATNMSHYGRPSHGDRRLQDPRPTQDHERGRSRERPSDGDHPYASPRNGQDRQSNTPSKRSISFDRRSYSSPQGGRSHEPTAPIKNGGWEIPDSPVKCYECGGPHKSSQCPRDQTRTNTSQNRGTRSGSRQ